MTLAQLSSLGLWKSSTGRRASSNWRTVWDIIFLFICSFASTVSKQFIKLFLNVLISSLLVGCFACFWCLDVPNYHVMPTGSQVELKIGDGCEFFTPTAATIVPSNHSHDGQESPRCLWCCPCTCIQIRKMNARIYLVVSWCAPTVRVSTALYNMVPSPAIDFSCIEGMVVFHCHSHDVVNAV